MTKADTQFWTVIGCLAVYAGLLGAIGGVLIARTGIILRELRRQRIFGHGYDIEQTRDLRDDFRRMP